ncbi:MAG: sulfotransferase family 2 domain-containing protein [Candidatus Pacearchaeota archaeon]
MPFKEFVKVISKIPDEKSDSHFRSQYKFLTNNEGNLFTEFIGKFENLEKDYKKICEIMGIKNPPKLKHERKSKRKNYRKYYDEETKKLVAERYKKDLELFGYRF